MGGMAILLKMEYLTVQHVLSGMEYLRAHHAVLNFLEFWFGHGMEDVLECSQSETWVQIPSARSSLQAVV